MARIISLVGILVLEIFQKIMMEFPYHVLSSIIHKSFIIKVLIFLNQFFCIFLL